MPIRSVQCIQHVDFEGPGAIGRWAMRQRLPLLTWRAWLGELPAVDSEDLVVILGGPMSASQADHNHPETLPWMSEERDWLAAHIEKGGSALGICLGAQFLADILGGTVEKNPEPEIGWFEIETTAIARSGLFANMPERFEAFHWHGEGFQLPPSAERLASTSANVEQGFLVDQRVVGLQFHLEITPVGAVSLTRNCAEDLVHSPCVQTATSMLMDDRRFYELNAYGMQFMDNYLSMLNSR